MCPNLTPKRARIVFPDLGPPQKIQAWPSIDRLEACKEPRPFDSSADKTIGSIHESLKRKLLRGMDEYSIRLVRASSRSVARQKHPLYQPTAHLFLPLDELPVSSRPSPFQYTAMSGFSRSVAFSNSPHSVRRKSMAFFGALTKSDTRP